MVSSKPPYRPASNMLLFGCAGVCVLLITGGSLLAQRSDLSAKVSPENSLSVVEKRAESASSPVDPVLSAADLPSDPKPTSSGSSTASPSSLNSKTDQGPVPATRLAPIYHRYIEPGETAQRLTPGRQFLFGLVQPISPYFLLTISAAAGYEQAVDGTPNYGSNISAYGQRVGAAAARNASQSFFSYSVMAPIFHEDVRYYIMGKRRSVFTRAAYAASRAVVTRDADDGHATPNYAEISGYAEAAALTNAYYPPVNRTFSRTTGSFGVSLGGLALSNVVREFLPDLLRAAHLRTLE